MNIKDLIKDLSVSIVSTIIVTIMSYVFKFSITHIIIVSCITVIICLIIIILKIIITDIYGKRINFNSSKHIMNEITKAKEIDIFVMKGDLFSKQDQPLHKIFEPKYSEIKIRFLMANPRSDMITIRAKEIFDRPYEHLKEETRISMECIAKICESQKNVSLKLHDEYPVARFICTEKNVFISFFLSNEFACDSPFYQFGNKSRMYKSCKRYFDYLYKEKSKEYFKK